MAARGVGAVSVWVVEGWLVSRQPSILADLCNLAIDAGSGPVSDPTVALAYLRRHIETRAHMRSVAELSDQELRDVLTLRRGRRAHGYELPSEADLVAEDQALRDGLAAAALGRKGGRVGGHARAAKLSPEQRSASARHAAAARWPKAAD